MNEPGNSIGRVTGIGVNCGEDCSENYASGTSVPSTATPAESIYRFVSWFDCDIPSGNICTVVMNQSKTVTATFGY